MTDALRPPAVVSPSFSPWALRRVEVRVLRDGEQTPSAKYVRLYAEGAQLPSAVLVLVGGAPLVASFLASALDREWRAEATDLVPPKIGRLEWPVISADTVLAFNLTSSSGGQVGQPAQLAALVRVQGQIAAREVVAVERLIDGKWQVAGYGTTGPAPVDLDLKVSGAGRVFAFVIDDWGVPFQGSLVVTVGQTIRPSVFAGWLYRITEAGQLPATEPEWWDESLAGPQPLGTARAEVVRYFKPQAHGPVPVEMI